MPLSTKGATECGSAAKVSGADSSAANGRVTFQMEPKTSRAKWDNKLQFILGVVSMAVGLGNVWRFPYLCQQNGGGAFLIPYIIMLFLAGLPLNLIELGIGQRISQGSVGVWNTIHPFLGGLGICSALISFFVGLYYNVVIAWCFYYLFNSFRNPLPWSECPTINDTVLPECEKSSPTAYYWYREAIDTTSSINETGGLKWWMVICLLCAWIIVYLCMMRGIQSSGKIMYFTALFPYFVLLILAARALTLEGAFLGLKYLIVPRLSLLMDVQTWMDAATQVLYSMSLAFGGLIAYASYNPPDNDCMQDAMITTGINLLTSLLTAVVVFAVLGFKASQSYKKCLLTQQAALFHHLQVNPSQFVAAVNFTFSNFSDFSNFVATTKFEFSDALLTAANLTQCDQMEELKQAGEGTGLAFIVFTQAIIKLPGAPFWSVTFFLMLLALGLGSQFGTMEGVITNIFDAFGLKIRKEILTAILCTFCFLLDLIFVCGAGEYWVNLIDTFTANLGLSIIALMEIVAVSYIYGCPRFCDDIENMTGRRPNAYWRFCWKIGSPAIISIILVSNVVKAFMKTRTYPAWIAEEGRTENVPFPMWAQAIGYTTAAVTLLPLVAVFMFRLLQCTKVEANIHQASVKRVDTTISTTAMMTDTDIVDDCSLFDGNVGVAFSNSVCSRKPKFTMEIVD